MTIILQSIWRIVVGDVPINISPLNICFTKDLEDSGW